MNRFKRLYYKLTAYVPRRLPHTSPEYDRFLAVLKEAYDVPDEPAAWATVGGQIKSTKAHWLHKPWGFIANAAKRLYINAVANNLQIMAQAQLTAKLEDAVAREVERSKAEENEQARTAALALEAAKDVPPPGESLQGA